MLRELVCYCLGGFLLGCSMFTFSFDAIGGYALMLIFLIGGFIMFKLGNKTNPSEKATNAISPEELKRQEEERVKKIKEDLKVKELKKQGIIINDKGEKVFIETKELI